MKATTTARFCVYLTEHQLHRLRRGSAETGLRQSELIRRTLDAHLDGLVRSIIDRSYYHEEKDNANDKANDTR